MVYKREGVEVNSHVGELDFLTRTNKTRSFVTAYLDYKLGL